MEAAICRMAAELRALSPEAFGVLEGEDEEGDDDFSISTEDAELAAGAVVYGAHLLVDELFQDVHTLTRDRTNVAECEDSLPGVSSALDAFADGVYEDMDHEWLYDDSMDGIGDDREGVSLGIAPMGIGSWFTPFNEDRYVHPYAEDKPGSAEPEKPEE